MEDSQIIDLYWQRSEDAICKTAEKYGGFCHSIAYNILSNHEDACECVNDTYLNAWKLIPPKKPNKLSAFLGKITRHIALDRWRCSHAEKRGHGEMPLVLEELAECIPGSNNPAEISEAKELEVLIQHFLKTLPKEKR